MKCSKWWNNAHTVWQTKARESHIFEFLIQYMLDLQIKTQKMIKVIILEDLLY